MGELTFYRVNSQVNREWKYHEDTGNRGVREKCLRDVADGSESKAKRFVVLPELTLSSYMQEDRKVKR